MVTWGTNTVHTFGGATNPAPAGGSLFAPAPAPSGGFGSSPAPAPGGFGGFSSTPAPSPGGGLFGTSAPSPGGSFFGSSAPSTGSLFGSPSGGSSLFGSSAPAPSSFGGFGPQQQQQQPQIPAQAAMHAHMEAQNRQETDRIKAALSKLHSAYSGTSYSSEDTKFSSIVYNDLTQEQRQLQWLHGMGAGGKIIPIAPPRPSQISEEEWSKAVVHNPDPLSYMPIPLVGADSLNARVSWQQERATQLAKDAASIKTSHETVQDLYNQSRHRLEEIKRTHASQRKRLLNVMRKVEVVRCMNYPLQPDEVRVMERLSNLNVETAKVRQHLAQLEASRTSRPQHGAITKHLDLPDKTQLLKILTEHHEELARLTKQMQKDVRDVDLMKNRVVPRLAGPPSGR